MTVPRIRIRSTAKNRVTPTYGGPSYRETQTVDRPVRSPSLVSDFLVPLFAAMAGSTLLSGFTLLLISRFVSEPEDGWLPLFGIFWLGFCFVFYLATTTAAWSLLWAFAEIVTQKDLDKSGSIGDRPILYGNRKVRQDAPDMPAIKPRDSEDEESGPKRKPLEDVETWTPELIVEYFPIKTNEQVFQWFVRVADQIGTGSRAWEAVLGRKRYNSFRNSLIENGWANWRVFDAKGKPVTTHGWELTEQAEEICRNIK